MRDGGKRILLTFVDLSFVRAKDIQTERVLHLLHDIASMSIIRFHNGKERPEDFS